LPGGSAALCSNRSAHSRGIYNPDIKEFLQKKLQPLI
jgi:hypothetical protein